LGHDADRYRHGGGLILGFRCEGELGSGDVADVEDAQDGPERCEVHQQGIALGAHSTTVRQPTALFSAVLPIKHLSRLAIVMLF
jgi:hypothetical protein